ncbi:MAG TPA: PAS domain S-box protein [Planctomycetota bacterium]|nr:PAS domain S-box protein [Planctomycetota bacterium]
MLTALLVEEGFAVLGCSTAAEAQARIGEGGFAVAVVDIRLPYPGGKLLLERLREMDPRVGLIIHTGLDTPESARKAIEREAFACVERESGPGELLRHVHRAFRTHMDHYAENLEAEVADRTAAPREREDRYRLLVETAASLIVCLSPTLRILEWNREAERVSGLSRDEVLGKNYLDLFVAPSGRDVLAAEFRRALSGERVQGLEAALRTRDGEERVLLWSLSRLGTPGEGLPGVIAVGQDITERKRAEEALASRNAELLTCHKLSVVSLRAGSLAAAFQEIVSEIQSATGFAVVTIESYDEARQMMVFRRTKGIPSTFGDLPLEVPVDETLSGVVARTGQLLIEPRAHERREYASSVLCRLGLRTFVCAPLIAGGRILGTLTLGHPDEMRLNDRFPQWITSLANHISSLIEVKGAEDALRSSEERFRQLTEAIQDVFWLSDGEERGVLFVSSAYEKIWGDPPSVFHGRSAGWPERVHPEDIERVRSAFESGRITGTISEEYRIVRPDGAVRWIHDRGFPIQNERGEAYRMAGIAKDITERKRAQETLRLQEALLRAMADSSPLGYVVVDGRTDEIRSYNCCFCDIAGLRGLEDSRLSWGMKASDLVPFCSPFEKECAGPGGLTMGVEGEARRPAVLEDEVSLPQGRTLRRIASDVRGNQGRILGRLFIFEDITERKLAEEALSRLAQEVPRRTGEAFFQLLVEQVGKALEADHAFVGETWDAGRSVRTVAVWSRGACVKNYEYSIAGTPCANVVGKSFVHYPEKVRDLFPEHEILEDLRAESYLALPLFDASNKPLGLLGVIASRPFKNLMQARAMLQISAVRAAGEIERLRAEEALRERERELRDALEEKERISQDLHDGILQSLYAVGLGLEASKSYFREETGEPTKNLNQAIHQLNMVMREVRKFIADLEPDPLETCDIVAALEGLKDVVRPAELRVNIDPQAVVSLSGEQGKHVLNIAREAVSNTLRHARATLAVITMRAKEACVRLEVRDNGVGFDPERVSPKGRGLRNMKSRALRLGWPLGIVSGPGRGTTVVLEIPKEWSHVQE